jgi:kynurenine formamidase
MDEWVGPGVVVDISDSVGDYDLYSPELLMQKAEIKKGDILIINTGYHKYAWDQPESDELRYFVKHPGQIPASINGHWKCKSNGSEWIAALRIIP